MTPEYEKIIADYYKKIGKNNNHIQNAEKIASEILTKFPTNKYEQTEFKISILFKIYEMNQLTYDELLLASAKLEDWRGAFTRQVFSDVNRVKKTLPLLSPEMRDLADRQFIRFHLEDKNLKELWNDETFLEKYISSYLLNAKEYHPFAQMKATFEMLNILDGTPTKIEILAKSFKERIMPERYAKNLMTELEDLDFYNTFKEMDLKNKIKYLDFFEKFANDPISGPGLEKILGTIPTEQLKRYPLLISHAKGETSEIRLSLLVDDQVKRNIIIKDKLAPLQKEIDKLEEKNKELKRNMPQLRDRRYDPRLTDEEEKLYENISDEQTILRQQIYKLQAKQALIKEQFLLEEKEELFSRHFNDILDKIANDLPITKNRIHLLTTSSLELAYNANQTTDGKFLSYKDLYQILKRSDPSLHVEVVSKFCFNHLKIPTRSKLYTCLQAINIAHDKNPLTFEAATVIDTNYMRYIASDEFEGYFDFRQTKKTIKEIDIEVAYVKVFQNFSNNNLTLPLKTFKNTKGVIINLGLAGKCLDSLMYFMRRI
jgi:cell division protein FtsB